MSNGSPLTGVDASIQERARKVKVLISDIDGVLTDGRIVYSPYGEELKFFDVQDGLGISLLRRARIHTVIITARRSRIVMMRCRDLAVRKVYQGYPDKLKPFNKILRAFRVTADQTCFIGDDIIDIPVMKRAGLAVAVPNAVAEVRSCAHYITNQKGGRGAVREICDLILKTQQKWDAVTAVFFR